MTGDCVKCKTDLTVRKLKYKAKLMLQRLLQ